MLRLLQFLFFGHVHKWKENTRGPLMQTLDGKPNGKGIRVFCTCETCGKPVKFDLI